MNLRNILSEIEKANPAEYEQVTGRRHMLKNFGSKVALAALPAAVGILIPRKAQARTTDTVVDALNIALSFAYFNYNYFYTGTNTGALMPVSSNNAIGANDLSGFVSLVANERNHIIFLNSAITSLGGTPYTPKNYDPTALNPFYVPTAYDFRINGTYEPFTQYSVFLILGQAFLDTTVRALKGQLSVVAGNTTVLTQYMQMHTVEARHAAFVRLIRRYTGGAEYPAPWITNDISPLIDFKTNYAGEDNLIQDGGFNIASLPDKYDNSTVVPKASATAAFDEPIDITFAAKFFAKFTL